MPQKTISELVGVAQQAVSDWEISGGVDREHWPALNGFSLYGLRHSAASYLIMNGVDIRTVAEIMGHRNISQTMRYTHFIDSHRIEAIQAIGWLGK